VDTFIDALGHVLPGLLLVGAFWSFRHAYRTVRYELLTWSTQLPPDWRAPESGE
jgi:hypothetical protein